jgi:hypothetical protein
MTFSLNTEISVWFLQRRQRLMGSGDQLAGVLSEAG